MKLGIYNEPSAGGIGGAESSAAVLAEASSRYYEVEIVHHRPSLTLEHLAEFSNTDLSAVRLRYVAPEPYTFGTSHNPWRRHMEARTWHAALSKPYDIFINFTHGYPPYCHAFRGILVVLFPLHARPSVEPGEDVSPVRGVFGLARLKSLYHNWEWSARMKSYQSRISISQFTQLWTKRRWDIDTDIIYPPSDIDFQQAEKANLILSVGRFASQGHSKNQMEMVTAFKLMQAADLPGWEYLCVGGVGDSPADQSYYENTRQVSKQSRATVLANIDRARLVRLYERAKLFWHAAGYGKDDSQPELQEHFGIATVEAMAAGCVPVVINKGGQPEIVRHGVDGFLWNTMDEMVKYTTLLAADEMLWRRMSEAARDRAQSFRREEYVDKFMKLIRSL